MAVTAFAGPLIQFGQSPFVGQEYNGERGPALLDQGSALMDPRQPFAYLPGNNVGSAAMGFLNAGPYVVVDQAPSTLAANNIAVSAVPISGTPFTLVSSTAAGITAGVSITRADTGATVTGLLAIDGAMGTVKFGQGQTVQIWDPTKAISRAVKIVSGGNDSAGFFTVNGYDVYGYPMSEKITGANIGTATGKKAFKYISSVVPGGTMSGSAITVGTADIYGFGLRVDDWFYVEIFWNSAFITATTGFTAAVTTDPATQITGDVRGTYAVQSASDGTKKLQVSVTTPVANLQTVKGLFGVTQV